MEEKRSLLPSSGAPEIYVFASIIVLLALSFVAYLLGEHVSRLLPVVYQVIAAGGLAEMYVANFVFQFDMKTRTLLSFTYLFVTIINVGIFNMLAIFRSRSLSLRLNWSFSIILLRLSDALSSFMGLFRGNRRKRRRKSWIKR